METTELKKLKKGDNFLLIDDDIHSGVIYYRGEYDRSCNLYRCTYLSYFGVENVRYIPSFAIVEKINKQQRQFNVI